MIKSAQCLQYIVVNKRERFFVNRNILNPYNREIKICPVPGGRIPEAQVEKGEVFPDIFTRAVVSLQMDEKNPAMRKTFYDFDTDPSADAPREFTALACPSLHEFRLTPHKEFLFGCGFVLELPPDLCAYIKPRGSTDELGLTVTNADVPIDPDFRGEPVFRVLNRRFDFHWIKKHQRLVQLVIVPRIVPVFVSVADISDLSKTKRANHSHGSSGT